MAPTTAIGEDVYSSREILYDAQHAAEDDAIESDAVARKRTYDRQRLRDHRRRERLQAQYLRDQVAALSAELEARSSSPLPWRDVAIALVDSARTAKLTNSALKAQLHYTRQLAYVLTTCLSRVPSSPLDHVLPHLASFQCQILPATHRGEALTWLTTRLYHHATHALSCCRPIEFDVRFAETESVSYMILQQQIEMPAPLEAIVESNRRIYLQNACPGNTAAYLDHDLVTGALGEDAAYFDLGAGDHALYRLFETPHRAVLVCSSITDETRVNNPHAALSNGWIIMDRLDATTTRISELFLLTMRQDEDVEAAANEQAVARVGALNNHSFCAQLLATTLRGVLPRGESAPVEG
ncbi:hypothetical protein SPRG_02233 [Saprolegnia parasitica CBS 223.65]|uniref:Uncharacterized protein n=1 Tax=Saprolegnia parasitica (strain CBS 223.65) TaxID=695850 RepID=A0A067D3V0_SAPPC|nr:hypothetical protein SPRG_02233 [Saprolegnia parasitica CBS 223.65]KDO33426.1 hypothetical protein SPRG_02233 [Saprolegnia parasitica CBS 223.65]|eukprot:XP_012196172.1 hypothetical protein SPRG_02233 [Saprolegnia parasitica CBS 223.65]